MCLEVMYHGKVLAREGNSPSSKYETVTHRVLFTMSAMHYLVHRPLQHPGYDCNQRYQQAGEHIPTRRFHFALKPISDAGSVGQLFAQQHRISVCEGDRVI